jgi:hypothetical protein
MTRPHGVTPGSPVHTNMSTEQPGWNRDHTYGTRFKAHVQVNLTYANHLPTAHQSDQTPVLDQYATMISRIETLATLDDGSPNFIHPSAVHNDVLHYGDMLHADDKNHFVQAMEDEVAGLHDMFEIVPRIEVPPNTKPLPAILAFKHKRKPEWTILKYKARLNVHGVNKNMA